MSKQAYSLCFIYLLIGFSVMGQKKILNTKSINNSITIDGKIDEEEWINNNDIATDFIMYEPDNGKPIPNDKKTEVKLLYDNAAIYISALLYDNEPDKILKEITNRDTFGTSDHFSVFINGFNDGQQDYRFYVSAAGVQMDCLATEDEEDFTWDAIWESKVKITDFGWVIEMRIPYAALRFTKTDEQIWGLNFMREIKRNVQKYTWNYTDTKIGAVITQAGILNGIKNIEPPTRLFLIPYTSTYYQENNTASDRTFKAGLDIKYGINDSFTLDAILVPDFGQTKFDNVILNLEPFEQTLDENRPFFTERTNLFTKGNLFYSRRIGGTPITDYETVENGMGANEEITTFPNTVNLINAVKVSGRTKSGLGIGVINAITEKTNAIIHNTTTNTNRKEVIQPLTNYNLVVLDQRFRQNSSVSFINSNTIRNGNFRDANVSALVFDLNTKANSYNLYGDFKFSTINDIENVNGIKTQLGFAKTSGQFRYEVDGKYIAKNYDTNDLGILFYKNYHSAYAAGSYSIVNPTKTFNTFRIYQSSNLEIENTSGKLQSAYIATDIKASTLKNDVFQFSLLVSPFETFDFYEPRADNTSLLIPKLFYSYLQFASNENRPFSITLQPAITSFEQKGRNIYNILISPKYRFNNQLSLSLATDYTFQKNDRGWAAFDNSDIIFSRRDLQILQNDITGKYAINNKMTLNLTARYYWSFSEIHQFMTLQDDGNLIENNSYTTNQNRNFNSWNFDLSYSWWFAPGSEISILYRNYAQESTRIVEHNLNTNFRNVLNSDLTSIFSIRLRYFIDYNYLVK